jgi:hypothetical protein
MKPSTKYEALHNVIDYCNYEIMKAKSEYKKGDISLKELQRVAKSLNNVIATCVRIRSE